ncbi:MAG: hypothetical protein MHM6MM_007447, partial [Cercozoa sp. M6MM]
MFLRGLAVLGCGLLRFRSASSHKRPWCGGIDFRSWSAFTAMSATASPMTLNAETRAQLREEKRIVALRIRAKQCAHFLRNQEMSEYLLNMRKKPNIVDDPCAEKDARGKPLTKLLQLNADIEAQDVSQLPPIVRGLCAHADPPVEVVQHKVLVEYNDMSYSQVLRRLLPDDVEVPRSFEEVGHLAHVQLREAQLPYRHLIGQVLLDKLRHIRVVVHKTASIASEFRVFPMEVLAKDPSLKEDECTQVTLHEYGAEFTFDFARVYWNSRLHEEHHRLVESFDDNTGLIVDLMAGVGPFAVPAAKKGIEVYANDKNPDSAKWLLHNVERNHVEDRVHCSNECARECWRRLRRQGVRPAHVIMNLPASAIDFCDVFHGTYADDDREYSQDDMPLVHVYCFARGESKVEQQADVQERIARTLGVSVDCTARWVRNVAPYKDMYCATFRLPLAVARGESAKPENLLCDSERERQRLLERRNDH